MAICLHLHLTFPSIEFEAVLDGKKTADKTHTVTIPFLTNHRCGVRAVE